ncbi:MAG: hypothetical protein KDC05_16135 [Bacteroidales bacterium]|nr:hypothetical protein [Bacteroidales bacterium]
MKKIILFFLMCGVFAVTFAQSPEKFNYQAVARNSSGDLLTNQLVSFRISLRSGSPTGTIHYQEIHPVTTNEYGLVNLVIGEGTPVLGDLGSLYWGEMEYYIQVELDPAGGSTYQNMGTSQLLSVPYSLYAKSSECWERSGDDAIMQLPGNVGIGIGNPWAKMVVNKSYSSYNTIENVLDISRGTTGSPGTGIGAGLTFHNESANGGYSLSGRISSVMENVQTTTSSAGMLFETRASGGSFSQAMYIDPDGRVGFGDSNPYYGVEVKKDMRINYPGTYNGLYITGNSPFATSYVENWNDGNSWAFSGGMQSSSAGTDSYGVYGFNNGFGYGVYGKSYSGGIGTYGINTYSGNYGYLGSQYYSVYGESNNGNYGYLGGLNFGVYGENSNGNYAILGGYDFSIYANLLTSGQGDYAISALGVDAGGENGTAYGGEYTLGAVRGYNYYGNPYTFGVAGYSDLDYARSGSCFGGSYYGSNWGAISYRTSGNSLYAGYFTTSIISNGTGKENQPAVNCGIGAWGDLFGADIHGAIYGAYIEGKNYATYANGPVFKNNLDVHLQKNAQGENDILYTSVSTDVTVQTCGYATLSNGKATISFDKQFSDAVSPSEPVIVTVTPMGKSGGIYLSQVDNQGFSIEENGEGKSNVMVSYIAIGKRKGYENPQLPQEVIAADYTTKLEQGLHNDNDMTTDGAGLYYENGLLTVGKHPSTYPDLNKPEIEVPAAPKHESIKSDSKGNGKAPEPEER